MRILHLADVHLDTTFRARSTAVRRRLRDASRDAFRRAVDLALGQDVHCVVVAGDLFDDARLSFQTEGFLVDQVARLDAGDVQMVYVTGDHDPGRAGLRAHELAWPDNVTVVRSHEPVTVTVLDRDGNEAGRVTGIGHQTADDTADLAAAFPEPEGELPEMAVLHTRVVNARGGERHEPRAPAELATIRKLGYDYWALGHVHERQRLSVDPSVWYAGNLQGRHPGETGAKGGLLVDLPEDDAPTVTFHPLGPIRWETLVVDDLAGAASLDELTKVIAEAWRRAREGEPSTGPEEWILRVNLRGPSPLHRELTEPRELTGLESELAATLGVLDTEVRATMVHPPADPSRHRERRDVLGKALRLLDAARKDPTLLEDLRPEVLAGSSGGFEEVRAYLTELLDDGLEGELVSRMRESSRSEEPDR